jgi:hypothetical protein
MVYAKSSPPSSGSNKLRKKNSTATNRTNNTANSNNNSKAKSLKTNQTPKKYKNKKTTKKSKKINKLLDNNDDTTDSDMNNYNKPKNRMFNLNTATTTITNTTTNTKILDTYDFDETNDSYDNVESFNSYNKIMSPNSSSASTSSPASNSLNYEGECSNDEDKNYYENEFDMINNNISDNYEKFDVHQYSKENLLTQSKMYQQKLSNLKAQLESLRNLSKIDNINNNSHIPDTVPEVRNYVLDFINECNRLDKESSENLIIVEMWHEKQKLEIDRQRDLELLKTSNEYSQKLKDLKQKLINQQRDLNKQLDIERNILDLNIDPADINHNVLVPVKRKLRRRNTAYSSDKLNHHKLIKNSNSAHNFNNITNNINLNNNIVNLSQIKPINTDC